MTHVPFCVKAVGRRKKAVANLTLTLGSGKIRINGNIAEEALLQHPGRLIMVKRPFRIASTATFDANVKTTGGGLSSQLEAIRLSLSRSLVIACPGTRKLFSQYRFLTRDAREKERRKYGLKKARKAPQFSKR
jgi:small subunit ribosomal protein S9